MIFEKGDSGLERKKKKTHQEKIFLYFLYEKVIEICSY